MSTAVLSQSENYDIFKNEVIANTDELSDFSEGSLLDVLGGAISAGQNELAELLVTEFMKTYFSTASGPTADDSTDYLNNLAVDHFGSTFSRPVASKSSGSAKFFRPSTDAGSVLIPIGTIIKTVKDSNGQEIRFVTTEAKTLTMLEVNVAISAVLAGLANGQVSSGKITVLESTLTDASVKVTNDLPTAGGADAPDDVAYRLIIQNLILSLSGATEAAVKGKILSVPGVAFADLVTIDLPVIEFNTITGLPKVGATYFRIPYPVAYVADSSGNSSAALIAAVKTAILSVRAAGVRIDVKGAVPIIVNWSASLTLNLSGPNYIELSNNPQRIKDSMLEYINKVLIIGGDFIRADANAYILSIWGPSGTNDITLFSTSVPSGDVSVAANQKTVAGTMNIV